MFQGEAMNCQTLGPMVTKNGGGWGRAERNLSEEPASCAPESFLII